MEKIFYADVEKYPSATEAVRLILARRFQIENAILSRTENGKPYLQTPKMRLHFSVSHTKDKLFIAFSEENVGLDCESLLREVNLPLLLKKFPPSEREEIASAQDFLKHWTVKESAVKWLGGTLAHDLQKLSFVGGVLRYEGLEIPVRITTKTFDGYLLTVCCEKDFSQAELIPV